MTEFIEILPNKRSATTRKLTHGVGVNDANYQVQPIVDGKHLRCPFYERWYEMIKRCYSKKYHEKKPTYKDCIVCDEWIYFSNFKLWMIKQNWDGLELDKDIIEPGNKVYSPKTCCFVSRQLNALLSTKESTRGKYPTGVCFDKFHNKFDASVGVKGKQVRIGRYETPEEAANAYAKAKSKIILNAAEDCLDERVSEGLKKHADILMSAI